MGKRQISIASLYFTCSLRNPQQRVVVKIFLPISCKKEIFLKILLEIRIYENLTFQLRTVWVDIFEELKFREYQHQARL